MQTFSQTHSFFEAAQAQQRMDQFQPNKEQNVRYEPNLLTLKLFVLILCQDFPSGAAERRSRFSISYLHFSREKN